MPKLGVGRGGALCYGGVRGAVVHGGGTDTHYVTSKGRQVLALHMGKGQNEGTDTLHDR